MAGSGGERRLGRYEALLLGRGEADVVASVEALLRALTDRLALSGPPSSDRKR
ncbi:MAG TPA: hypothetical protein VEI03_19395 [Stellaceae bacterium]|nr:hypothetical protein [Stellaceae bacterium]